MLHWRYVSTILTHSANCDDEEQLFHFTLTRRSSGTVVTFTSKFSESRVIRCCESIWLCHFSPISLCWQFWFIADESLFALEPEWSLPYCTQVDSIGDILHLRPDCHVDIQRIWWLINMLYQLVFPVSVTQYPAVLSFLWNLRRWMYSRWHHSSPDSDGSLSTLTIVDGFHD